MSIIVNVLQLGKLDSEIEMKESQKNILIEMVYLRCCA